MTGKLPIDKGYVSPSPPSRLPLRPLGPPPNREVFRLLSAILSIYYFFFFFSISRLISKPLFFSGRLPKIAPADPGFNFVQVGVDPPPNRDLFPRRKFPKHTPIPAVLATGIRMAARRFWRLFGVSFAEGFLYLVPLSFKRLAPNGRRWLLLACLSFQTSLFLPVNHMFILFSLLIL